jgi:mono/diheme cytochrome c family protein
MNRVMSRSALVAALSFTVALAACKKGEESNASEPSGAAAAAEPAAAASPLAALKVPDIVFSTAQADLDKGKELFSAKGCNGCHKIGGGKLVGPDLKGVTGRRDKQWIAKMILRPDLMTKEDPTAKDLFKTYMTQMPNQGVPEADLPALISYLKSNE